MTAHERDKIVNLVRLWGGSSADAVLDPTSQFFLSSNVEGLIGYKIEKNTALVFGDPVASLESRLSLAQEFKDFCDNNNLNPLYVAASDDFSQQALDCRICSGMIQISEELFIDPYNDPRERHGIHASLVRRKVRHAANEGTIIEEYLPFDQHIEEQINQVGEQWLKSRTGPQIHISNVHIFENKPGKRWFYAKKNQQIIGMCVLNEIKEKNGWLLNHLMITPTASNGTPELLIVSVLEKLKQENCRYVTFGTIPAKRVGDVVGFSNITSWLSRGMYNAVKIFFHLDGRRTFWEKFHPDSKPTYLLFGKPQIGINEIFALKKAMNVSF